MFAVMRIDRREIVKAIESQYGGDVVIRQRFEQKSRPAQGRGRVAHRGDRVTNVVLAVAKGALAIFPRLTPVNRRQTNQKGAPRQRTDQLARGNIRQSAAPF